MKKWLLLLFFSHVPYKAILLVLLLQLKLWLFCNCTISFSRHLNVHAPPIEDENDQRLEDFLVEQGNTEVHVWQTHSENLSSPSDIANTLHAGNSVAEMTYFVFIWTLNLLNSINLSSTKNNKRTFTSLTSYYLIWLHFISAELDRVRYPVYLAHSANLPTGIYILPSVISFFLDRFLRSFHQIEGICVNVVNPVQFFRFLNGSCHGNQFLRRICEMTFIQHSGILKRIGISQYG